MLVKMGADGQHLIYLPGPPTSYLTLLLPSSIRPSFVFAYLFPTSCPLCLHIHNVRKNTKTMRYIGLNVMLIVVIEREKVLCARQ